MAEILLNVPEVAETLRIRKETVRRYIREGRLKALTLPGGSYRIRQDDLKTVLRTRS